MTSKPRLRRKYGDAVVNYPNMQTKHLVGLLLFSGIASLLVALGSPYLPLFFLAFLVFAMSVIDIVGESGFENCSAVERELKTQYSETGAGLLNHQLPFNASCSNGATGAWANFGSDCKIYTALEGVSWAKWAIGLLLTVALVVDAVLHSKKQQKRHFVYGE